MGYGEAVLLSADEVRGPGGRRHTPSEAPGPRRRAIFTRSTTRLAWRGPPLAAGVHICADTVVEQVFRDKKGVLAVAKQGRVRARHAILAGDALLAGVAPRAERQPGSCRWPTTSSPPRRWRLPTSSSRATRRSSDSRFVVNYYRLTPDGRLMFGGGERYSRAAPADIAAFVRPHLEAVFPRLQGVAIDHAWGGLVSITFGRDCRTWRATVTYSSPRVIPAWATILSTLGGKLLVEALAGETARFDLFAKAAPPTFPGGPALRTPRCTRSGHALVRACAIGYRSDNRRLGWSTTRP